MNDVKTWLVAAAGIMASVSLAVVALFLPFVLSAMQSPSRLEGVVTSSEEGIVREYNQSVFYLSYGTTYSKVPSFSPNVSRNSTIEVLLVNVSTIYDVLNETPSSLSSNQSNASRLTLTNSQLFNFAMSLSLLCSHGSSFSVYPDLIVINSTETLPVLISFLPNDSVFFPSCHDFYSVKAIKSTFSQVNDRVYAQVYLQFHIKESQFQNYQVMLIVISLKDKLGSTQNIVFILFDNSNKNI